MLLVTTVLLLAFPIFAAANSSALQSVAVQLQNSLTGNQTMLDGHFRHPDSSSHPAPDAGSHTRNISDASAQGGYIGIQPLNNVWHLGNPVTTEAELRAAIAGAPVTWGPPDDVYIIEIGGSIDLVNSLAGAIVIGSGQHIHLTTAGTDIDEQANPALYPAPQVITHAMGLHPHFQIAGFSPPFFPSSLTFTNIILEGSAPLSGGGVMSLFSPNAHFEMRPGSVVRNISSNMGAIRINGGTFTMTGGEIHDTHTTSTSSALSVNGADTVFTMRGGKIHNNLGTGGANDTIHISSGATFNMYGGEISDNISNGAAVRVSNATFNLRGTDPKMIVGNTANAMPGGGVDLVTAAARMNIEAGAANVHISGNTAADMPGFSASGSGGGIFLQATINPPSFAVFEVHPTATNIYMENNHAGGLGPNNGGGAIFTGLNQSMANPLDLTADPLPYSNIRIPGNNVTFNGNTAATGASQPPSNAFDPLLNNLSWQGTPSIYNHILNNYDINFRGMPQLTVTNVEPSGFAVAVTETHLTITFNHSVNTAVGARTVTIARQGQPPIIIPVPNDPLLWAESPASAPNTVLTLPIPNNPSLLTGGNLFPATRYDVVINGFVSQPIGGIPAWMHAPTTTPS